MNIAMIGLSLIEDKLNTMPSGTTSDHLLSLTKDIQESCKEAVKILTGILDYEKLGAGLMKLEQIWLNPFSFILAAVKPFMLLAEEKGIKLDLKPNFSAPADRDGWVVHVDEAKMSQVVRNYVSNALKFTPTGGSVDIVTRVKCEGGEDFLRFEVIDSGPGIAAGDIGKVFNEVVQFNANAQQAGGGSGVGLWICKKIVDLHGGHVRVESVVGLGSTFSFELPVKRKESLERAISLRASQTFVNIRSKSQIVPTQEESLLNRRQSSFLGNGSLRVLIVDDSKLNRKMMNRLMTDKGHICTEVCDGDAALQVYDRYLEVDNTFPFDVILMDNNMPVMSGREATAALRCRGFVGIIIGVTGDALQTDIDAFLASGVTAVLSKPIDVTSFNGIVRELLRGCSSI